MMMEWLGEPKKKKKTIPEFSLFYYISTWSSHTHQNNFIAVNAYRIYTANWLELYTNNLE